jgi:uncharacterized protein (TIGR01244 family)
MAMLHVRLLFALAVIAAAAGVVGYAAIDPVRASEVPTHVLDSGILVSGQISIEQAGAHAARGFKSIIDLRPDGESPGQPTADAMRQLAQSRGMQFHQVPVARGAIDMRDVDALAAVLPQAPRPLLLYCGSGQRAARTWALVEARRSDGMTAAAILAAVRAAGLSADDIADPVAAAVRARSANPGAGRR